MANTPKKKESSQPDFATIGGLVLAFGGIITGLMMEGGRIRTLRR